MKQRLQSAIIAVGLLTSIISWSQMTLPPSGNNQKSEVTQYMGIAKVTITYSSPDVAAREIRGKLVPYGLTNLNFAKSTEQNPSPWRAGANENTTIMFSHDVQVEGKPLKDSHVSTFQGSFKEIQAQQPAGVAALVAAIEASKLGIKRKDDKSFQALMRSFSPVVAIAAAPPVAPSAAPASAPVPTADNPMNDVAALPAAAPVAAASGPLLWLALGMAGLGLLGVALLWNKLDNARRELNILRRTMEAGSPKAAGSNSPSPVGLNDAIKQEITRQIDQQRRSEQQATAAGVPAAAPPVASPLAAEPAAPAPRLRQQFVDEAPFNNGFPARALRDQPGTYSMFAIVSSEQQPDQGTFAVTGNLASHVRDHRSVLEPVCEYVGGYPLGSESRVVTVEPGLVRRRGDDWEVVQRAKVRFE